MKGITSILGAGVGLGNGGRFLYPSLRSRRLEVVGTRKNERARRRHARGEGVPARKAHENRFPLPRSPNLITWQPLRDLSKVLTEND